MQLSTAIFKHTDRGLGIARAVAHVYRRDFDLAVSHEPLDNVKRGAAST